MRGAHKDAKMHDAAVFAAALMASAAMPLKKALLRALKKTWPNPCVFCYPNKS
jgi:hypothetical protein